MIKNDKEPASIEAGFVCNRQPSEIGPAVITAAGHISVASSRQRSLKQCRPAGHVKLRRNYAPHRSAGGEAATAAPALKQRAA